MSDFLTKSIASGVNLHILPTKRFKTTTIKVFLQRPLDEKATLTALLPNVLKRGTMDLSDALKIEKQLEQYYGASLGADVRKIGERHIMEFVLRLPNANYLKKDENLVAKGIEFLSNIINNPRLDKGKLVSTFVEQEKNALAQNIMGLFNDKGKWAMKRCVEETCAGEPYAIFTFGDINELPQISPQQLTDFYHDVMASAQIDIFVTGTVNPDEVEQQVHKRFGIASTSRIKLPETEVVHNVKNVRVVTDEEPVNQGKLVLSLRTNTGPCDSDFEALLLCNSILGGGTHSKLFANVREKHSLAYYAHSIIERVKGLLLITSGIEFAKYDQAVEIIKKQLADIKQGTISEQEFNQSKVSLFNGLRTMQDYPGQSVNYYLQGIISGCPRSIEETKSLINEVKITDVAAVAEKFQLDTIYFLRGKEAN